MLKELIKIANELDERGLTEEADVIEGVITKVHGKGPDSHSGHQAREHLPDSPDVWAWDEVEQFISDNLSEDTVVYSGGAEEPLGDLAHNNSTELRDYMIEVLPDKIADLSTSLDMDPDELKKEIIEHAKAKDEYNRREDTDFAYIVDAADYYLNDYGF